jgi:hypothetical protein
VCQHAQWVIGDDAPGRSEHLECHRFPPHPVLVVDHLAWVFPRVTEAEFCWEFISEDTP